MKLETVNLGNQTRFIDRVTTVVYFSSVFEIAQRVGKWVKQTNIMEDP